MNKIIIIFTSHRTLESGGIGTHLRYLISELSRSDYEHYVLLSINKRRQIIRIMQNVFSYFFRRKSERNIHYFLNLVLLLSAELEELLAKISSDHTEIIIHCHDRLCIMAASLLKKKYNIKIVSTIHAPFTEQYEMSHPSDTFIQQFAKIIEPGLTLECEQLIAVDALQKQIIEQKFNNINLNITQIINSVDIDISINSESYINKYLGIEKYLVVARHLFKKNGVEYAIRAFSELENKNYSLIIIGSGDEKENIINLIEKLSLKDRVRLLGAMPHNISLNIIAYAKLSLVPSISVGIYIEAASLTMLESMLLGTPVVASNIGGLKQVLVNNETGILVNEADTHALAIAIDNILKDEVLYEKIKNNARKEVIEKYNTSQWFSHISNVYNNI